MTEPITPQMIVWAYTQGFFPMAQSRDSNDVQWYSADPRTVMPLDRFHVPRSLAKLVRRDAPRITLDRAFDQVIRQCAEPRNREGETWINPTIIDAYTALHESGIAHSVEAWEDEQLVGGLYGVALGGAFFGESMFSRRSNASKICLVHLVNHLRDRGFALLDTQFTNPHLAQFGIEEISREQYLARLEAALRLDMTF
jgi:leucyl/phenylalanyl-tRNA--protein transferase